jgi:anti-sigma factor RsiW
MTHDELDALLEGAHAVPPADATGDEDAEARHGALAELLGAYADGELPPAARARVEAHLLACDRCRRVVAAQTGIGARLAAEPVQPMAPVFRDRVFAHAFAQPVVGTTDVATASSPARVPVPRWRRHAAQALAWSGWAVAAALTGVLASRPTVSGRTASELTGVPLGVAAGPPAATVPPSGTPAAPPMVEAALVDYRRVRAAPLPATAPDLAAVRASVPFPVVPLRSADVRLLAAWTTRLRGEPTAALAYRWGDRVIVQYVVPERLFFRQPDVRAAVANGGVFTAASGAQGVVAWPAASSGALLVGDAAPAELARVQL